MIIDVVIVVVLIGAAFALGFILGWNASEARYDRQREDNK